MNSYNYYDPLKRNLGILRGYNAATTTSPTTQEEQAINQEMKIGQVQGGMGGNKSRYSSGVNQNRKQEEDKDKGNGKGKGKGNENKGEKKKLIPDKTLDKVAGLAALVEEREEEPWSAPGRGHIWIG